MKHLFKSVILTLGLLLIIFSCQKDDNLQLTESSIEAKKEIRPTITSWTHLKDKKKILAKRLADINQLNNSNRVTTSSVYGFTISDTQVQYAIK